MLRAPRTAKADDPGRLDDARRSLSFAEEAAAPTDDAGRRFFDGDVLRGAGFAVPADAAVAVPASYRPSRAPLARANAGSARRVTGLRRVVPPAPDADGAAGADLPGLARGAGKVLAAFDAFQRSVYADPAQVVSRWGWRAAKRKGRPVPMTPTHVTVHHTQGPQTMSAAAAARAVRNIQHYHMVGRAAEGKDVWDDIGYHFLIDGAGDVAEGRPAETLGAHAGGANENNIGIAMMGDFNRLKPTPAQVQSLTRLVSFLAVKYHQDPARAHFLEPHQHYNNTDCPGKNMMSILKTLRGRIDAETDRLETRLAGAKPGQFVPVLATDA